MENTITISNPSGNLLTIIRLFTLEYTGNLIPII